MQVMFTLMRRTTPLMRVALRKPRKARVVLQKAKKARVKTNHLIKVAGKEEVEEMEEVIFDAQSVVVLVHMWRHLCVSDMFLFLTSATKINSHIYLRVAVANPSHLLLVYTTNTATIEWST